MTKNLTFCGICCALSVVLALLTDYFPYNTVFLLCAASALFPLTKIKCGTAYSFTAVSASAIVAFILVGNKVFWLSYTLLSVYAVLKGLIENINKLWAELIIKLSAYVLCAAGTVFLLVPDVAWYVVALGAVIFLIYDFALSLFVGYMRKKLRLF